MLEIKVVKGKFERYISPGNEFATLYVTNNRHLDTSYDCSTCP